jgi:hypothetical protein
MLNPYYHSGNRAGRTPYQPPVYSGRFEFQSPVNYRVVRDPYVSHRNRHPFYNHPNYGDPLMTPQPVRSDLRHRSPRHPRMIIMNEIRVDDTDDDAFDTMRDLMNQDQDLDQDLDRALAQSMEVTTPTKPHLALSTKRWKSLITSEDPRDDHCPICLEPLNKSHISLKCCGHHYCDPEDCGVDGGLRAYIQQGNADCAICRANVLAPPVVARKPPPTRARESDGASHRRVSRARQTRVHTDRSERVPHRLTRV